MLPAAASNSVWNRSTSSHNSPSPSVAGEYGFAVREVKVYGNPPKVEVAVYKEEKKEGRIQVEKVKVGNRIEEEKEETVNHTWNICFSFLFHFNLHSEVFTRRVHQGLFVTLRHKQPCLWKK